MVTCSYVQQTFHDDTIIQQLRKGVSIPIRHCSTKVLAGHVHNPSQPPSRHSFLFLTILPIEAPLHHFLKEKKSSCNATWNEALQISGETLILLSSQEETPSNTSFSRTSFTTRRTCRRREFPGLQFQKFLPS